MTETVSTLLTLQLLYVFNVSCCKHFDWFHIDTVLSHTKMCISGDHELVQHKFWMQVFELCCFSCACALPSSDSAVRTDLNTCPCTSVQTLQNRNNIDGVFRIFKCSSWWHLHYSLTNVILLEASELPQETEPACLSPGTCSPPTHQGHKTLIWSAVFALNCWLACEERRLLAQTID